MLLGRNINGARDEFTNVMQTAAGAMKSMRKLQHGPNINTQRRNPEW